MTPRQIEILMRIVGGHIVEKDRVLDAYEVEALVSLVNEGMVKDSQGRSTVLPVTLDTHRLTERGNCFVDVVLKLPLPGRRSEWVMPA